MSIGKKVVLLTAAIVFPFTLNAANVDEIIKLEKLLVQKETLLLEPELKLDRLLEQRSGYDGMSGWFQGSKKKALEAEINETESEINARYAKMRQVAQKIQKTVFNVAYAFESQGDYQKAIEYYLKVENRDDKVRFRIASCFKAMSKYQQAIKWLMEMRRTDETMLEIADCYKLNNNMRETIYWLFEVLEPYDGNAAELTALQLIEKYDYPQRRRDYPDFYERLSSVYIAKAGHFYDTNFVQAGKDYRKAVQLLANEISGELRVISFSIVERYHNKYRVALEILDRQREAAEHNFNDRLRRAQENIRTQEDRLRRAQRDADREYEQRLSNAQFAHRRAQERLRDVRNDPNSTQIDIDRAQRRVDSTRRDLDYVRRNRTIIIRDYLRPYQRRVDEARDSYNNLASRRAQIIAEYIAPYRKQADDAKTLHDRIRALHNANFS